MKILRVDNPIWYDFNDNVSFSLKPCNFSTMENSNTLFDAFGNSIIDWKGLTDENDKNFECTDENKKYLFDYSEEIRNFVFEILNTLSQNNIIEKKT